MASPGRIPEPDDLVATGRGERSCRRARPPRRGSGPSPLDHATGLAGGDVPEADGLVVTAGDERLPVRSRRRRPTPRRRGLPGCGAMRRSSHPRGGRSCRPRRWPGSSRRERPPATCAGPSWPSRVRRSPPAGARSHRRMALVGAAGGEGPAVGGERDGRDLRARPLGVEEGAGLVRFRVPDGDRAGGRGDGEERARRASRRHAGDVPRVAGEGGLLGIGGQVPDPHRPVADARRPGSSRPARRRRPRRPRPRSASPSWALAVPPSTSHRATVRSPIAAASVLPSGAKATALTSASPSSIARRLHLLARGAAFQSLIERSRLPLARVEPSGEKARACTPSWWPASVDFSAPASTSQTFTEPSRRPPRRASRRGRRRSPGPARADP